MREKILIEATRQFAAGGFDATPLQAIADAVGIRKASLLYHFSNKAELRVAVLEGLLGHWQKVLPRLLEAATSHEDQFSSVVSEVLRFFSADPNRARLIVREALDRPDDVRALIDDMVRPWVTIVCDYIRKGQRQGRVWPDADPEAYVVVVTNLIIGSVAMHECLNPLLCEDAPGADIHPRCTRELVRICHHSMFRPQAHKES